MHIDIFAPINFSCQPFTLYFSVLNYNSRVYIFYRENSVAIVSTPEFFVTITSLNTRLPKSFCRVRT